MMSPKANPPRLVADSLVVVRARVSSEVALWTRLQGGKGKGKGDEKQPDDATDQAQQAEYKVCVVVALGSGKGVVIAYGLGYVLLTLLTARGVLQAIRKSLQWPLDAFIYRTFTRLDLKLSPHRHVETYTLHSLCVFTRNMSFCFWGLCFVPCGRAGEHILVQVEQCRDALNKAMKRSMLTRAIKVYVQPDSDRCVVAVVSTFVFPYLILQMLKALDPSTVDTRLISPSDIW